MRNEIIDIRGATLGHLSEFVARCWVLKIPSFNSAERLFQAEFPWDTLKVYENSWYGSHLITSDTPQRATITIEGFLYKYQKKPKYSLGGIYDR